MQKYSLIAIFFLFLVGQVIGQSNPASLNVNCIKNDSVVFTITSTNTPEFVVSPTEHISTEMLYLGNGIYQFTYYAGLDYIGLDQMSIKYFTPSGTPGAWPPAYITVNVSVSESILEIANDFIDVTATPMNVQPLNNDVSSGSELSILTIGNLSNCEVSIVDSLTLSIDNILDNEQIAYVQYIAQDTFGNSDAGMITLRPSGYEHSSSLSYVINKGESVEVILKEGSYSSSIGALGTVTVDNSSIFKYTSNAVGTDNIVLIDENSNITNISIKVLNASENKGFLRNDYYYTGQQEEVLFDAYENDLEGSYFLVGYSSELIHDTLGMFSYNPLPFEHGYKNFYYTVYNGFEHQTATITIKIDDYSPLSNSTYQFASHKNETYVIDYDVPVSAFDFTIATAPSNGEVLIDGFQSEINNDCGDYEGHYIIQYTPNTNYFGTDYFELEFCATESGDCNIVKIEMNISADEVDCECIGNDCIWPGDTNNDGVVDNNDLLSLGYCLGQSGPTRSNTNIWTGTSADDWNDSFLEEDVNAKHVDANGDGVISSIDLDEIITNYGSSHGLISNDLAPLSKINLDISTDQDTVYTGEWLFLDVSIGKEQFPLVDIQGLSLQFNFPTTLIDSSSFFMDYHDDSWFTHGSPTLELTTQPEEGKIRTAYTRTSKNAISGDGIIATLGFIVEDDLVGIRLKDNTFDFKAIADNIMVMGLDGKQMRLETTELELTLKIKDKKADSSTQLLVYPNPADQYANIYSNMSSNIDIVEVRTIDGRLLSSYNNIDANQYSINTASLNNGLYIVTAYSKDQERSTQKIQVIH